MVLEEMHINLPDVETDIESPLQPLINSRVDFAHQTIMDGFENDDTDAVVIEGGMAGSKSTLLKKTVEGLRERGNTVHVYKWSHDIRGDNGITRIMIRGDKQGLPAKSIATTSGIHEDLQNGTIKPGDYVAASEVQFLGSDDEISTLVSSVNGAGVKGIYDFLGAWFNTYPVSQVSSALNALPHNRTKAFCLQGYDSFNPSMLAEMTFRGVGVGIDPSSGRITGEILHPEDALYYVNQGVDVSGLAYKMYKRFGNSVLVTKGDVTLNSKSPHILIPSHPTDPGLAVGMKRYKPASLQTYREMSDIVGFDLTGVNLVPITQAFDHPSFVNWPA